MELKSKILIRSEGQDKVIVHEDLDVNENAIILTIGHHMTDLPVKMLKDIAEEIVKKANQHDEIKQAMQRWCKKAIRKHKIIKLQKENLALKFIEIEELRTYNRKLVEQLEVVKSTYDMGHTLDTNMISDIKKVIERGRELDNENM